MATKDPVFLTVKQASELLGIAPNTLRSWSAAGKIDEYRHPVNNYRLYSAGDVETLRGALLKPKKLRASKEAQDE